MTQSALTTRTGPDGSRPGVASGPASSSLHAASTPSSAKAAAPGMYHRLRNCMAPPVDDRGWILHESPGVNTGAGARGRKEGREPRGEAVYAFAARGGGGRATAEAPGEVSPAPPFRSA